MKRAYLLCAAIILSLIAVTGTIAYFTDQIEAVGIVESGEISILQHESERIKAADGSYTDQLQPYTQEQMIYPGSSVDKIVTVENNGKNIAYVRTFVAIPSYYNDGESVTWLHLDKNTADGWVWADKPIYNVSIDGTAYDIHYATNMNQLKPGQTTAPSLLGYMVDPKVDYQNNGYILEKEDGTILELSKDASLNILVATEASQAIVFENADQAMNLTYGGEPSADRHPWKKIVFVRSAQELTGALASAAYDTHISLMDGTYTLPATLPAGIRIFGAGLNVKVSLAETLYAYDFELDNVTVTNAMHFSGHGNFEEVVFNNGWTVSAIDGDIQFDQCVFDTYQIDAGSYNVTLTRCQTHDGVLVNP